MRRNFLGGFLLCFIPTLIATFVVLGAANREVNDDIGFRRGIDLAGGTILVYEVNLERSLRQQGTTATSEGLSNSEIKLLAENIKRRIDPNDLQNIIVRPVGNTRIELILPFTGSKSGGKQGNTTDFVQATKAKIRQVGVLEFRILANTIDDRDGLADAKRIIESARTDSKVKADLEDLARRGLPPLPPPNSYAVTVQGQTVDDTTYQWIELSKEERASLGLSNRFAEAAPEQRRGREGPATWLYPEAKSAREADGGAYAKAGVLFNYGGSTLLTREYSAEKPIGDEGDKGAEYFMLTRRSPVDAVRVERDMGMTVRAGQDEKQNPSVNFAFNSTGAARFGRLTERNRADDVNDPNSFRRRLAIILDEKIVSAPSLNSVIRESGQITGDFDLPAVNRLVDILRSGALNAELKPDPVSENSVGPTLGQETIRKGLVAVGLAFAAVLAFMIVYYQFAGVVACIALFVNLLLTVGFMVMVNAAFTLPGLAGIVLMLGMAVDANVLIYERIREEREKGANLMNAVRLGYDRAFGTIIDTHLTSIFTCIILYAFGNDNLKGFSISLTVGLLISLFTALYLTRLVFDYGIYRRWLSRLRMLQLFRRPNFDFMKIRRPMFVATALVTLLGAILVWSRGDSVLNVDFTKGTAYGGRLAEGQERGLTDSNGKAGLLTLFGEAAIKDRLAVQSVAPLQPAPEGEATPSGSENTYEITYADGTKAIVSFVNTPEGVTEAERLADVKQRASTLPGVSIEQVYRENDNFGGGQARSFTVRTTEREPELVQVGVDRLLRDAATGEALLNTTKVTKIDQKSNFATLTLDRPAAPRYVAGFIERELKLANRWPGTGSSAAALEVRGVPSADEGTKADEERTGLYSQIAVSVAGNIEFQALNAAVAAGKTPADPAAKAAETAFQTALEKAKLAFESRPLPERLETFDPSLAADTRNQAIGAIFASWLGVLAFLWFRFGSWAFGLAAVLCLIHDLSFTLGAIALCHYLYDTPIGTALLLHDFKIDLAAVAALLTLVGYSVNDTIVVFDRIREVRGKNPALTPAMINDSVNQTLSRTVLASLTVFLVVGVLYLFGGEGIHLFAFVMVIGVLVGTYSSIYIASPLLLFLGEGQPKIDPRFPNRPAAAVARR